MAEKTVKVSAGPASSLLTPKDSVLILIDHQPQMVFGVGSMDRQLLVNNVTGLAKASKIFDVPTILTTIAAGSFSGPILDEIRAVHPDAPLIDRSSMNAWEDEALVSAVVKTGRKKLVMAALWTEVCLAFPVLSALEAGYEAYIVADASAGTSAQVHDMAIARMVKAGAVPVTWLQVMLEWQRDWARKETYDAVNDLIREHAGAYGQGVAFVRAMLGGHKG